MQVLKDSIRENILNAATDEFFVKSFCSASMRDIAKRAGVTLSNTYNYFSNKNELFFEIISPIRGSIFEIFSEAINSSGSNGPEFNHYVEKLAGKLADLSDEKRKSIVILIEKSKGTEFEMTREKISAMLEEHFAVELGEDDGCVYNLIASNFISGILTIMKYGNKLSIQKSLEKYLKYHINGIFSLK